MSCFAANEERTGPDVCGLPLRVLPAPAPLLLPKAPAALGLVVPNGAVVGGGTLLLLLLDEEDEPNAGDVGLAGGGVARPPREGLGAGETTRARIAADVVGSV